MITLIFAKISFSKLIYSLLQVVGLTELSAKLVEINIPPFPKRIKGDEKLLAIVLFSEITIVRFRAINDEPSPQLNNRNTQNSTKLSFSTKPIFHFFPQPSWQIIQTYKSEERFVRELILGLRRLKMHQMPETIRQSSQFNKSLKPSTTLCKIDVFRYLGTCQEKPRSENLTKPLTRSTKLRKSKYIFKYTWWWVGLCRALCCKTMHPCGAKSRCRPQHNSRSIP
jgi:hypothetical protein